MSIQKKSLINTLKSAKKANVVKEEVTTSGATASPVKVLARKGAATARGANLSARKGVQSTRRSFSARKGSMNPRIVV